MRINAEKVEKLKSSIKEFFKGEEKEFTPIKFFENALEGANFYVLKVRDNYVGVYEVRDEIKLLYSKLI